MEIKFTMFGDNKVLIQLSETGDSPQKRVMDIIEYYTLEDLQNEINKLLKMMEE